jgi:hypothetical protein
VQIARAKLKYQSRSLYPSPSTGSTSRSTAQAAGGPRSVGKRYRLGDGVAHLFRRLALPPQARRLEYEAVW